MDNKSNCLINLYNRLMCNKAVLIIFLLTFCPLFLFAQTRLTTNSKPNVSTISIDAIGYKTDTFNMLMNRYYPQGSAVQDHKLLFNLIHGQTINTKLVGIKPYSEIHYDTLNNYFFGKYSHTQVLKPGYQVFGWHPYWMNEQAKYYPYSLLSTVAFFAYDVNEHDGTYYDTLAIHTWRKTSMIDSAKKYQTNVLLTVTSYGTERNTVLLNNKSAWSTLGDSLEKLLLDRNAQGIDIDFAGITKKDKQIFCEFMNTLRSKIGEAYIITMHVTSKDLRDGVFDLLKLKTGKSNVSVFIVQGFDYEEIPTHRRAMAPLFSSAHDEPCIVHTVDLCLKNGLTEKDLVLNLPLFGTKWNGGQSIEMSYDDIVTLYEVNDSSRIQFITGSAYLKLNKQMDSIIWYESSESIYRKFAWAKANRLGGVGLWGLGYDGGREEIWDAIAINFGLDTYHKLLHVYVDNGLIYSILFKLQQYRKVIGVTILIIFSFYMIGLLLSLLDWRVREIFFRRYIYRALLSMIGLFILIIFLIFEVTSTKGYIIHLVIGSVIGGVIVYLITKKNIKERKKMP